MMSLKPMIDLHQLSDVISQFNKPRLAYAATVFHLERLRVHSGTFRPMFEYLSDGGLYISSLFFFNFLKSEIHFSSFSCLIFGGCLAFVMT